MRLSSSRWANQDGTTVSRDEVAVKQPHNGTDQENGTSFDQMAGAIWRSVTLGFFLLFLLKQLSKLFPSFSSFVFFPVFGTDQENGANPSRSWAQFGGIGMGVFFHAFPSKSYFKNLYFQIYYNLFDMAF